MKDYNYQGESFLNRLYKDLHISDEVMHTASLNDTKDEKVRKYLERLEKVEEVAKNSKYNGIELLKEMYYKKYVIKPENVPESYFETQQRIALERGFGHVQISHHERVQMIDSIINDQKKSLDIWLDYFLSGDSLYPEWFKYYAFQGMLKLGSYDKSKSSFNKRTDSTTNIFVDLNREALALVYDNLCNVLEGKQVDDEVLQKLLEGGSFSKLYAYTLKKLEGAKKDILDGTDGIWIKYNRGSEPDKLVKSLEGKGTGWCTAGIETAGIQLQSGDFYVYYTKDLNGEYEQPRIAIRMEGNSIGEIRGISEHQNLESEMEEVLEKKLEEFADRDKYKKKVNDMNRLTAIYKEYKNRDLTTDELRFLYEIDNKIEGFGYQEDPRIEEILVNRSFKKDLVKVFNCKEEEITDDGRDVLSGKKIVCFYGDFCLRNLTIADELILPENIIGSLDLNDLISAKVLKLPKIVTGNLGLNNLIDGDDIVLPDFVGGDLNLGAIKETKGLFLPKIVGGGLNLYSLISAKNVTFPKMVGKYLFLTNLKDIEGLVLPKHIGECLELDSLTSAVGLVIPENMSDYLSFNKLITAAGIVFPKNFHCSLYLNSLQNCDGLVLPENIYGDLVMSSIKNIDNVKLPKIIDGSLILSSVVNIKGVVFPSEIRQNLDLECLESAEDSILSEVIGVDLILSELRWVKNVVFPRIIGDTLDISWLYSTEGLIVPEGFKCRHLYNSDITIQDLVDKSLEKKELNKRQKGFSKLSLLIIINIIIIIGIIFLGCLFMI